MTTVDKSTGELIADAKAEHRAQHPARVRPTIQTELARYQGRIAELLAGTGVSAATFTAQIANACRNQPKLLECDPATVLGAALRCAQLGLAPNDPRNLAWIIPYGRQAQFQIGYGGVLELARRAEPGLRFDGRPVYPNDVFHVDYGNSHQPLQHSPAVARGKDRGGDAFAWYVRAIHVDGTCTVHVLDREGVEYHRKFSKNKDAGMWRDSYDAAALKSVVMDMRRWLPASPLLAVALGSDQSVIDVAADDFEDVGAITHNPEAET